MLLLHLQSAWRSSISFHADARAIEKEIERGAQRFRAAPRTMYDAHVVRRSISVDRMAGLPVGGPDLFRQRFQASLGRSSSAISPPKSNEYDHLREAACG